MRFAIYIVLHLLFYLVWQDKIVKRIKKKKMFTETEWLVKNVPLLFLWQNFENCHSHAHENFGQNRKTDKKEVKKRTINVMLKIE